MTRFAALLIASAALAGAAYAGNDVNLPPFEGIAVHGGGHATLRHGPSQRVTVLKGDPKVYRVEVKNGVLDLSPCSGTCWGSHDLDVEIVSPNIRSLNVHGGGTIETRGDFPKQPELNLEVHGGGDADTRAIPAETINANVHGGGDLRVKVLSTLNADVHGGGEITYIGHPPRIHSQTHGGGSIHSED